MKKWFDEEYEFTVEVTGFLRGDHTERYCRNGEEIGDTYTCTYGCPVNKECARHPHIDETDSCLFNHFVDVPKLHSGKIINIDFHVCEKIGKLRMLYHFANQASIQFAIF